MMITPSKYPFCVALLFVWACFLKGCAPISRESCINDSAYDIGHAAAMENADRTSRFHVITKVCNKQGREVDEMEYRQGFESGTDSFCEPSNGYRWGLKGKAYNGICADTRFGFAYEEGRAMFAIAQRRTEIKERLSLISERLNEIAVQLDKDETLGDERRRALRRKRESLLIERSDLLDEQHSLRFK